VKVRLIVVLTAGFVCAVAIVGGFLFTGSPEHDQRIAADRARIDDLRSIATAISLDASVPEIPPLKVRPTYSDGRGTLSSAVSTAPYPYRRIDARHFELCATFLEKAPDTNPAFPHDAGNACFRFDARDRSGTPSRNPNLPSPSNT
jgi:hypothetical protein